MKTPHNALAEMRPARKPHIRNHDHQNLPPTPETAPSMNSDGDTRTTVQRLAKACLWNIAPWKGRAEAELERTYQPQEAEKESVA